MYWVEHKVFREGKCFHSFHLKGMSKMMCFALNGCTWSKAVLAMVVMHDGPAVIHASLVPTCV